MVRLNNGISIRRWKKKLNLINETHVQTLRCSVRRESLHLDAVLAGSDVTARRVYQRPRWRRWPLNKPSGTHTICCSDSDCHITGSGFHPAQIWNQNRAQALPPLSGFFLSLSHSPFFFFLFYTHFFLCFITLFRVSCFLLSLLVAKWKIGKVLIYTFNKTFPLFSLGANCTYQV